MNTEKRFIVDGGIKDLPFPIKVKSKTAPEGQPTVANISVNARIMKNFEPGWIHKFIHFLHQHRDQIGDPSFNHNIYDLLQELNANLLRIDFGFPFFIEKLTPVSREKCLVKYSCQYSVKVVSDEKEPGILYQIKIPVITSYPTPFSNKQDRLLSQLSIVSLEVKTLTDIFIEDLVNVVEKHALMPIYSFLTDKDQEYVIENINSRRKTSIVMLDEIKMDLARYGDKIDWFTVLCSNHGIIHNYFTFIGTETNWWSPFGSQEEVL